jgi:hypothetical protein
MSLLLVQEVVTSYRNPNQRERSASLHTTEPSWPRACPSAQREKVEEVESSEVQSSEVQRAHKKRYFFQDTDCSCFHKPSCLAEPILKETLTTPLAVPTQMEEVPIIVSFQFYFRLDSSFLLIDSNCESCNVTHISHYHSFFDFVTL